jgi:hypothetical protein
MGPPARFPTGLDNLKSVDDLIALTYQESSKHLKDFAAQRQLIGTALSILYQAATCHRKCHGGGHVLESLWARMYNLGVAAYRLSLYGLYDEALNLCRSIGEVSNLIALSVVDKKALREWLAPDKKTRLRDFSPSRVRKALERLEPTLLLVNEDWYSRFCETFTHVTPQTKPNMHNATGKGYAGGVYQSDGLTAALDELANVLVPVSMIVCRYFNFLDLFEEISTIIDSLHDERIKADSGRRP